MVPDPTLHQLRPISVRTHSPYVVSCLRQTDRLRELTVRVSDGLVWLELLRCSLPAIETLHLHANEPLLAPPTWSSLRRVTTLSLETNAAWGETRSWSTILAGLPELKKLHVVRLENGQDTADFCADLVLPHLIDLTWISRHWTAHYNTSLPRLAPNLARCHLRIDDRDPGDVAPCLSGFSKLTSFQWSESVLTTIKDRTEILLGCLVPTLQTVHLGKSYWDNGYDSTQWGSLSARCRNVTDLSLSGFRIMDSLEPFMVRGLRAPATLDSHSFYFFQVFLHERKLTRLSLVDTALAQLLPAMRLLTSLDRISLRELIILRGNPKLSSLLLQGFVAREFPNVVHLR
jgi:hypothetical protein